MTSMRDLFTRLFAKGRPSRAAKSSGMPGLRPISRRAPAARAHDGQFAPGERIGEKFVVRSRLGEGGCGIVYLATKTSDGTLCALKTFRAEFMDDAEARAAFKKEAVLWVGLGDHPCVLAARWVEDVYGRLFVEMDYIPKDENGCVTLADHIARATHALDLERTLEWAVQLCLGMEHANAHGIGCHRDIKPGNLLIGDDGMLKIADFGLAGAAQLAWRARTIRAGSLLAMGPPGNPGMTVCETQGKGWCGTPGYLPPEAYRGEQVDVRGDIYSFGAVLWQMASASAHPPHHVEVDARGDADRWVAEYMDAVYGRQKAGAPALIDSRLQAIVERCLAFDPARRYADFGRLRKDLEALYSRHSGKRMRPPKRPNDSALSWNNKGASLNALGRHEEGIACCDKALAIDPRFAAAWNNKANNLCALGRHDEAIACYDNALECDSRDIYARCNKGTALERIGRHDEALACLDQALEIDPRDSRAWNSKGNSLQALGRFKEATACYDKALAIDPRYALAWNNKGLSLHSLGRDREAMACHDEALEIDPRNANAWNSKGLRLDGLGRYREALACFGKTLDIDARHADATLNKGNCLDNLGRHKEAMACYEALLKIDRNDALAWYNKALTEEALGRAHDAAASYRTFLKLGAADRPRAAAHARERLRSL